MNLRSHFGKKMLLGKGFNSLLLWHAIQRISDINIALFRCWYFHRGVAYNWFILDGCQKEESTLMIYAENCCEVDMIMLFSTVSKMSNRCNIRRWKMYVFIVLLHFVYQMCMIMMVYPVWYVTQTFDVLYYIRSVAVYLKFNLWHIGE